MTVFDLIDVLENIAYSDDAIDSEVYIQIGGIQAPVNGISYFPEVDGVVGESVVIGDEKEPKLIL